VLAIHWLCCEHGRAAPWVELALPALNPGWTYYPPTTREIHNRPAARSKPHTSLTKVLFSFSFFWIRQDFVREL
jgi:hypothetical protein